MKRSPRFSEPKSSRKVTKTGKYLYIAFSTSAFFSLLSSPVLAAPTVWQKANEIMKDVYNQILLISTIAGVVTAAVALLMMNFSKNGKTVDESRAWLKRIGTRRARLQHGNIRPILSRRQDHVQRIRRPWNRHRAAQLDLAALSQFRYWRWVRGGRSRQAEHPIRGSCS